MNLDGKSIALAFPLDRLFSHARISSVARTIFLTAILASTFVTNFAEAADYFVRDTLREPNVTSEDAKIATNLVKSAVSSRQEDTLVEDEYRAAYVLQPRLMALGGSLILTVEKLRGEDVLFAAQAKISEIDQLDRAARSVTTAAIEEPSPGRQTATRSIATDDTVPIVVVPQERRTVVVPEARTVSKGIEVLPPDRKMSYWSIGVGPFIGRRLETDGLMYGFTLGHVWDINPRATVKVIGEAALPSTDEDARFLNLATGFNYFFPGPVEYGPYVTADFGYGFARDADRDTAEGVSFGTGIGLQFFRDTETTLDLLLRYSVVLDAIPGEGNPSIVGLRMAVNF